MMHELDAFASLFEGRHDVYGDGNAGRCIKEPVYPSVWHGHLEGKKPIGIYPRVQNDECHWGCSDFDKGYDAKGDVVAVRRALGVLGIWSSIELSRSKGYHLWVFLPDGVWLPASVMRRAFLLAHHLAEVPATEVNPKQDHGPGIGNYVRLPYPERGMYGKQVMLAGETDVPLSLADFLAETHCGTTHVRAIIAAADLYTEKIEKPAQAVTVGTYNGKLEPLVERLHNGVAFLLFRDGPLYDEIKGRPDRSLGLFNVTRDCKTSGLEPQEALALLQDCNERWGKGPAFEPELEKMVRKVYSND